MFEAKLAEALVLKKIIDAIKDLVTDVNIDATPQGKCPWASMTHVPLIDNCVFQVSLCKRWTVHTSPWSA